ncbi:MAG TPA: hypothetical protein VNF08_00945 [Acidimicrobiales bacterium]|nr:hypothetical protein [Acidimicrobiales bacterium]
MTSLLDATALSVMDVLRGERETRPIANTTAASGLRAQLEDGIFAILGPTRRDEPLTIRSSSLRVSERVLDLSSSLLAQVRGLLVTQALRLLSVGLEVENPFDEALLAWRADVGSNELTSYVDQLESDEWARLATDVTAHCVTLKRSLGPLPSRWLPRTSLRAHQRLGGGGVVLRDVIDLMVGTTTSDDASVALLDVTTSPLSEGAERVMRYHALVQTLRTSTVPLRTSMFSTATGELWSTDVDDELLSRAVGDVLETLRTMTAAP